MSTRIPWADETWNPMTGCTPVSEACQHCYAERMAKRFNSTGCTCHNNLVPWHESSCPKSTYFRPTFHPDRLDKPLHWRKPRRIFVNSMSDLFHEAFTDRQIMWVLEACECAPQHTYLVLTKRPERMRQWFTTYRISPEPFPHLWLGVTAENQSRADERIPILLDTPAAVRFVSVEPMLGPVDFRAIPMGAGHSDDCSPLICAADCPTSVSIEMGQVNWVILGGETGPGARPMNPEWALGVYRRCKAAGVPFFFKQWGSSKETDVRHSLYGPDILDMTSTRAFPAVQP